MSNNQEKKAYVYLRDGRIINLDQYFPELLKGITIEEYPDRMVKKEFGFNKEHVMAWEIVTINKKQSKDNRVYGIHFDSDTPRFDFSGKD